MATDYVDAGHAVNAVTLTGCRVRRPRGQRRHLRPDPHARSAPQNLVTYYGAYWQRYSPLDQINTTRSSG
jgi:hypothetical protein